ncbi:MAG: hypothetical protein ACU0CO_15465 [Shimia sp.]
MSDRHVVYGYDPLCGWCFGLLPAWEAFHAAHPDVIVEVLPGGLVTGARVGPYRMAAEYIRGAAARMAQVTGQQPQPAFFDLIEGDPSPWSASAPPSHAVLQAQAQAPAKAAAYAHALSHRHFTDGADLSKGATFEAIGAEHGLTIDGATAEAATETTPLVADAFASARALGIASFPTTLVLEGERPVAAITGVYDPHDFTRALAKALGKG